MIDWKTAVEDKLTEFWLWEILNAGKDMVEDAETIIPIVWDYENGVRPNKSFLGLKTNSITPRGGYFVPNTQRYDDINDIYYQQWETTYNFVVSFNAFGKDCYDILMKISETFQEEFYTDMLQANNIAYVSNEAITDITELEQEGQNYERRLLMDVFFNFAFREEKAIDVIETIEIGDGSGEGSIDGYNDPDSSIKIVEIEKIFNV